MPRSPSQSRSGRRSAPPSLPRGLRCSDVWSCPCGSMISGKAGRIANPITASVVERCEGRVANRTRLPAKDAGWQRDGQTAQRFSHYFAFRRAVVALLDRPSRTISLVRRDPTSRSSWLFGVDPPSRTPHLIDLLNWPFPSRFANTLLRSVSINTRCELLRCRYALLGGAKQNAVPAAAS